MVSTLNVDPSMVGIVYWSFPQALITGNDWVSFQLTLHATQIHSFLPSSLAYHIAVLKHTALPQLYALWGA